MKKSGGVQQKVNPFVKAPEQTRKIVVTVILAISTDSVQHTERYVGGLGKQTNSKQCVEATMAEGAQYMTQKKMQQITTKLTQ